MRYIITIVSCLVISGITWLYEPSGTISIGWFVGCVGLLSILCIMLIQHQVSEYINKEPAHIKLPRLLLIKSNKYIFEPSALFSSQALVSLFHIDDVERYMGLGHIETVQSDKKNLQVAIVKFEQGFDENYAKRNKRKIILKPTIPLDVIQKTHSGGGE